VVDGGAGVSAVQAANAALAAHMKRHSGALLTQGTYASEEFDRLYLILICARWDAGDPWVRGVWTERPAVSS
jgi:hypothetical protein